MEDLQTPLTDIRKLSGTRRGNGGNAFCDLTGRDPQTQRRAVSEARVEMTVMRPVLNEATPHPLSRSRWLQPQITNYTRVPLRECGVEAARNVCDVRPRDDTRALSDTMRNVYEGMWHPRRVCEPSLCATLHGRPLSILEFDS